MRYMIFLLLVAVSGLQLHAESLFLEDIVDGKYTAQTLGSVQSLPDGEHYAVLSSDSKAILKYAYGNGRLVDTLFHVDKVQGTHLNSIEGYLINSSGYRILVWNERERIYRHSWQAVIYDYDVRRNFLKPLSDKEGKLVSPVFSPNGKMVAFIRDNNVWLKKLDYDTETQITKDGEQGRILNGVTDWAYEEEFSQTYLMSWSADGRMLAFLKSDISDVPVYAFSVFDSHLYPNMYSYKYPKAGQTDAKVSCYVFDVLTGDTQRMDVPLDEDGYIPNMRFTKHSDKLAVMTLNRRQNRFDMYFVNPKSTLAKLVLRDENRYYLNPQWIRSIVFSENGFVYVCEKSGFAHIGLYSMTGIMEKQMTSGQWDVSALYGFNSETQTVYYQSSEESPLRRSIYKIDAKGNKTRLSSETGWNEATFSGDCRYFINTFSNVTTPSCVSVRNEKGKETAVLNDNMSVRQALAEAGFAQKEFFTFTNNSGEVLNGWMIKPSDFSNDKRYPSLLIQYGAPGSQKVKDKYDMDWYYYLAEQGYIIVSVDGRGTGSRGEMFRKCTYLRLGLMESDDQIAAAEYLSKQEYIDSNRIAVCGWGYGGLVALMSMSRSSVFNAGIAIAPIVDWRYYNSIYTERFMRTPQENADHYKQCSPVTLVDYLQGALLLVHGTADDNVHVQHTMLYSKALIEAGKMFDMQIYPDNDHRISDNTARKHLYKRISTFLNSAPSLNAGKLYP